MMRGVRRGLLLATLMISVGFMLSAGQAQAQEQQESLAQKPPINLTTSPSPLLLTAKPGQTLDTEIRVKNNGTKPERLSAEILKFDADGETGSPRLHERGPRDQYFDWLLFPEKTFEVEPGVWKTVKVQLKIPPTAAYGYYYAVVFSRATDSQPTKGMSGVKGGIATLVLLNVQVADARRQAEIVEFSAGRRVYEFVPASFTARLKNGGNVHVAPVGNIFIKRGSEQVQTLEFNKANGHILPNSKRAFTAEWVEGFPAYRTVAMGAESKTSLDWDFGKLQQLRFGKYTAHLVAVYDDGQRDVPVEATVDFWVVPWRILAAALLVLLVIGAGLWFIMKSIWKGVRRNKRRGDQQNPKDDRYAQPLGKGQPPSLQEHQERQRPGYRSDNPVAPANPVSGPAASSHDRQQASGVVPQPSDGSGTLPSAPPLPPAQQRRHTTPVYRPAARGSYAGVVQPKRKRPGE